MTLLNRFSIAQRLGLGFAAVIAIFLVNGGIALYANHRLTESDARNRHTYEVLAAADGMLKSMINMETGARGFMLSGREPFLDPWNNGRESFSGAWTQARKLTADDAAQQRRLDEIKARRDEFEAVITPLIEMRRDVKEGRKPMADFVSAFNQGKDKAAMDGFRATEAAFDATERSLLAVRGAEGEQLRGVSKACAIFGSIAAVLLAWFVAVVVSRSITRPLARAVRLAEDVAKGKLGATVEVTTTDEVGRLLLAMQGMQRQLSIMVTKVRDASERIATGSAEIANGNADLSQRTEEQAANLQQTAASMEELTATVKTNASTAQLATELAEEASSTARGGGAAVGHVVTTMDDICASSREIAEITGVIDGIAFQTNILALNAAVEAARAGEHGRGFAVVASEVRTLAQRSGTAARQIKDLIARSVAQVSKGSEQAAAAGSQMATIVTQVERVTTLISEIGAATRQQTQGIGQVGDAVSELDRVTQQNTALVEESAAAAESLSVQAVNLVQAVGMFELAR